MTKLSKMHLILLNPKDMEKSDITLEESFALYNEGMQLLKQCNETIDAVEKKVQVLDENGEVHEF